MSKGLNAIFGSSRLSPGKGTGLEFAASGSKRGECYSSDRRSRDVFTGLEFEESDGRKNKKTDWIILVCWCVSESFRFLY